MDPSSPYYNTDNTIPAEVRKCLLAVFVNAAISGSVPPAKLVDALARNNFKSALSQQPPKTAPQTPTQGGTEHTQNIQAGSVQTVLRINKPSGQANIPAR